MGIIESFCGDNLVSALQRGGKRKPRRSPASQELAELHGTALSPSLARLVDTLAGIDSDATYGEFGAFGAADWLPGRANALTHALAQPFRTAAALTGALALGPNGAGDTWLFCIAARKGKNEVFLLGHDRAKLHPIADSVEAFFYVQHLLDREAPATPSEVKALRHRARSAPGVDISLPKSITGFKPQSPVAKRLAASADLLAVLEGFRPASRLKKPAKQAGSAAPEALAAMLRAFLRLDDALLDQLVKRHVDHPARLIRDAVELLGGKSRPKGGAERAHSLGLEAL